MAVNDEIVALKKRCDDYEARIRKLEALIVGSGVLNVSKVNFTIDRSGSVSDMLLKIADVDSRIERIESLDLLTM